MASSGPPEVGTCMCFRVLEEPSRPPVPCGGLSWTLRGRGWGAPAAASAPGPRSHHQTFEELGELGELVAVGALVAADGPHQHEDGRQEALLQGLVLAEAGTGSESTGGDRREWGRSRTGGGAWPGAAVPTQEL